MLPYAKDLDEKHLHVQAPTDVIFLCGGQTTGADNASPLKSLRDAFLKIIDFPVIGDKDIIQAEDITGEVFFFNQYDDVLAFETDLAQITELILLFCESAGSFAELGAFAMIPEIAQRLLVVIQDSFWNKYSFIKLGPLRALERAYGNTSVFVIDDSDTGMSGTDASRLDKDALKNLLDKPLEAYFGRRREPTTFDRTRAGHVIKLMVGLIQDYGALCVDELAEVLALFSVQISQHQINSYLLCAKAVGWISLRRKGSCEFYVAVDIKEAATFRYKAEADAKNKLRRRSSIMDYWRANDSQRYAVIVAHRGGLSR